MSAAAKKRRSEAPEGEEEGEGGGVDRISGLPDAILGDIISLLPTKDGARTQALASRWRDLWRSAPLNLDSVDFPAGDEAFAGTISRILSAHWGPGRRFRVAAHLIHQLPETVDAWIRSPALHNLQEINFFQRFLNREVPPPPPPASISRFSGSLRVALFVKCHITDGLAESLRFPELKQLGIDHVRMSEASLHSLISSCPALECLFVNESYGFLCLRINSISLRSIGMRDRRYHRRHPWLQDRQPWLEELIIEDAPCLDKLLYSEDGGLCLSVVAAPKLAALGCPSDWDRRSKIFFGATKFKSCMTLDNYWCRNHRLLLQDLDIRLKTVVMENYRGIRGQVQFASFFVMNARELEVLRLEIQTIIIMTVFSHNSI